LNIFIFSRFESVSKRAVLQAATAAAEATRHCLCIKLTQFASAFDGMLNKRAIAPNERSVQTCVFLA